MTRKDDSIKDKIDRLNKKSSFFELNTLNYGNLRGKMSELPNRPT